MKLFHGDCLDVLEAGQVENESVDLIVTSPPYANQRKSQYGGVDPLTYNDWFLERSKQFQRVLGHRGSFVLNIKEHTSSGVKDDYVIRLILSLQDQGWRWVEEYVWHKKNAYPGKWPDRFRNAWGETIAFHQEQRFQDEPRCSHGPTERVDTSERGNGE